MPTQPDSAIAAAEARALFDDLETLPVVLLAVSGGPDSVALLLLAARWRKALRKGPDLIAVTVDHGLRPQAKAEAQDVARLAKKLGVAHRTLRWTGPKPKTGLPQAARHARYWLLADAARKAGAAHILTAHTLDDQAETVMIRMMRGSGMTGLAAMQRTSVVPGRAPSGQTDAPPNDLLLVRPLLGIPKARLIATLASAKIVFADDPTNRDPAFTRARLRGLMPQLAREGLDAGKLALLARRLKRADRALDGAVERAHSELSVAVSGTMAFDADGFALLPEEIRLRLLGRAIDEVGSEGPIELAKLEALAAALDDAYKSGTKRWRRSLAGALVTLAVGRIAVETAPPRRKRRGRPAQNALTKARPGRAKAAKLR